MKILLLCNKAPLPPDDGSSIAIYSMAEGLRHAGAEIHVWAINTKKHFKPEHAVPEEFKTQWNYVTFFHDTGPTPLGALKNLLFSRESYFAERFYIPSFEEKLQQFISQHQFDIIQLEGLFMGYYIPLIRKNSKALVAYRAHNVEFRIWERLIQNEKNPLKKFYLKLQTQRLKVFEHHVILTSDVVIPITGHDEKEIRNIFKHQKPSLAIPTGLWKDDFSPLLPAEDKFNLLFFGALEWLPNAEAALWLAQTLFPELKKHVPNAQCVIAGRNMPESLKKLKTKGLMLMENVTDKTALYQNATVFTVPLLSGSGLKIKMLEAMALGKCIVCTPIAAEGIERKSGREFFIFNNVQDFIQIMVNLSRQPGLIRQTGLQAADFVKVEFDRKKLGKKLFDFYKTLIS